MRWRITIFVLLIAFAGASCTKVTTGNNSTPQPTPSAVTTTIGPTATVTKEPPSTVTQTVAPPEDVQPTGPASACNYSNDRPNLRRGDNGSAVQQAQCYLNLSLTGTQRIDLPLLNGDFGPLTDSATRRFQRCAGITEDGVIGSQTWSYLVYWASEPNYLC